MSILKMDRGHPCPPACAARSSPTMRHGEVCSRLRAQADRMSALRVRNSERKPKFRIAETTLNGRNEVKICH